MQRVCYTDSHQIHTRSAVFRACFAMFRACFADVSRDVSHVSRVFREVSRLFRTVAHRPSTRKVYVLHRGSSYSHILCLRSNVMCSIRHQNTEELVLWHHIAAFRRRFAGVSQRFADVSRMFRGCFAGRFARFARVSRMFRKNSRRLRAVNLCSGPAAPRVHLRNKKYEGGLIQGRVKR